MRCLALPLAFVVVAVATAREHNVRLRQTTGIVDAPPVEYKLVGAETLSHGWDILSDEPMPTPIFRFHYGGSTDPQNVPREGGKAMELLESADNFLIPDECEARPSFRCDFSASTEVFQSVSKYARHSAREAGISADLSALGAFSASASVMSAAENMESGDKDMFVQSAECVAYKIRTTNYASFHPTFVAAFAALPETAIKDDASWKAYSKFFETFGTHLVTQAALGGLLRQTTYVAKSTTSTLSVSAISASLEAKLSAAMGSASASAGASSEKQDSSETSSSSMESVITTEGGQPGSFASEGAGGQASWGAWAESVVLHATPVRRRMSSIADVLSSRVDAADPAAGTAGEALCRAAGVAADGCSPRLSALREGVRRFIKQHAPSQSTTYEVYVHFADAAEDGGGSQDPANELVAGAAAIPARVRALLPAGALDDAGVELDVCSFECMRSRPMLPDALCDASLPLVRVFEAQAKGCAALREGAFVDAPDVLAVCKARSAACSSGKARFTGAERMSAVKAADIVDAPPADEVTSAGAGTGAQPVPAAATRALQAQLLGTAICEIACVADDPFIGKAKPCVDGNNKHRVALIPEDKLPGCHLQKQGVLTKASPVLEAPEHCGGCGVPRKGRFVGSFRGDPQRADAERQELHAIAGLPRAQRTTACEYECLDCQSASPAGPVVVSLDVSEFPTCPNHLVGDAYGAPPVLQRCAEYGCKGKKAVFLRAVPQRRPATQPAPEAAPGTLCMYTCPACGQTVELLAGVDLPTCGASEPGAPTTEPAVLRACAARSGCHDTSAGAAAVFQSQRDVTDVYANADALQGPQDVRLAEVAVQLLRSNDQRRAARSLGGRSVVVSEAMAHVDSSIAARDVPLGASRGAALVELSSTARARSREAELPVLHIAGELGDVSEWHLGVGMAADLSPGKLAVFTRTLPSVGNIASIDLTIPAGLAVRMLRVTDVESGAEYVFDVRAAGPAKLAKLAPVRMDAQEAGDGAGVAVADQSQSPVAPGPLNPIVVPEMARLYRQLDKWHSDNRYDFFLSSTANRFVHEHGDVVITLSGTSGSITVPVPAFIERYWSLLGVRAQLPVSSLPNALHVRSRSSMFRNFKAATDTDAVRVAFFAHEGAGVGELRTVHVAVKQVVRPGVLHVAQAPYSTQREVAQRVCGALLGSSGSATPTDSCAALVNGGGGVWPDAAAIMRETGVVGINQAHCEAVKAVLQRGSDMFQCWFEQGRWHRFEQTPDYARSVKRMRRRPTTAFATTCDGHGRRNVCADFFEESRAYFDQGGAVAASADMRSVQIGKIKVVDYRNRRVAYATFNTEVNEYSPAVRDLA